VIEIVYYVAASLDGFIATADGGVEWLKPFEGGAEDYGYGALLASMDALLMGARTYEFCAALPEWPYPDHPSWVLAHGAPAPAAPNVRVTADAPREVVAAMERAGSRRAWLVGGGRLAASLRAEGLIGRYIVSIIPMVLSGGLPMLAPGGTLGRLELVRTQAYPSGIVQVEYRAG
jgi:dihydrofolate reductase